MGANHSDLESETFKREDWVEVCRRDKGDIVWRHSRDANIKIVSYPIFSHNQREFKHQKQLYYLRKNNPRLVSALFLEAQEQTDLCSSNYKHQLYLENIPITLLDVQHIPYPDHLHLYEQCLSGFYQLATAVGCFLVEEEYIGITDRGVVKVWLNGDFHSSFVVGSRVLEEIMVQSIIDVIDRNVDHLFIPPNTPSVKNYLFRNHDSLKFQTAIHEFGQFVRNYNGGKLPSRLECIDRVGGVQVILNRESSEQEAKLQEKTLNNHHQSAFGGSRNGVVAQSSSINSESSKDRREANFVPNESIHGVRYQNAPVLNVVRSSGQFQHGNINPTNHVNVRMIPQQQLNRNGPNIVMSSIHPNPVGPPVLVSSNQMQVQREFQSPPRFIQPQRQIISNPNLVGPSIQVPQPLFGPPLPGPRPGQLIYQPQPIPAPYIFNQSQNIPPFQPTVPIFTRQRSVKTMPFTVEVIPGKVDKQIPGPNAVKSSNQQIQQASLSNPNKDNKQIQEEIKQKPFPATLEISKQQKYQQAGPEVKKISDGLSYRHSANPHDARVPSFINQRQKLHSQTNKSQKDKDSPNQQKGVDIVQIAHNQPHLFNQNFESRNGPSQIFQIQNQHNIPSSVVEGQKSVEKYEGNPNVANQFGDRAKQVSQQSNPVLKQKEAVPSYDLEGSFNPAYTTFMSQRQNNQQQPYSPTKNGYEDISYGITANKRDYPSDNPYKYDTFSSNKQYINVDDGKSSEQFLSQLRSLQSGSVVSSNSISSSAAEFGNYGNYYESTYKNTIGEYDPNSYLSKFDASKYAYGGSSYLTNNYNYQPQKHQNQTYSFRDNYVAAYGSKQIDSENQFGKSAISRMAPQTYPSEDLPPRQPYKFETNVDLAYSKTENLQLSADENASANYHQTYKLYTQP